MDRIKAPLAASLLALLSAPLVLLATPMAHGANWYQVEVVVFAQSDTFGSEANLKSVRPDYPGPRVFLGGGDDGIDPRQLARLAPADLALYRAMVAEQQLYRSDPLEPVPFAPLDAGERLLDNEAAALARSGSYQVLFHQAWRQTIPGSSASPWVVVQGGRMTGQHHELEGSLRFFSDREGHINIDTRLWRTRFGAQAPQLATAQEASPASQWPILPTPPQPEKKSLPAIFATAGDNGDDGEAPDIDGAPPAHYALVDLDTFNHQQIVNSRELYYIDHPRLGALVRVIPYDPTEQAEDELVEDAPEEDFGSEGVIDSDEPRD